MIHELKIYACDEKGFEGKIINAKIPVSTFETPTFHGVGDEQMDAHNGARFEFDIPGENIEEAFRNYNAAYQAKLKIVRAEWEEQKRARKADEIASAGKQANNAKIAAAAAGAVPKMTTTKG